MKIKELLKGCSIYPPNVVIGLLNNGEWLEIELWEHDDFSNFIATYGNSLVHDWVIENIDTDTYVLFNIKKLVENVKSTIKPTTKEELLEIIHQTIEEKGLNCDLNFIDVSDIEDMNWLFAYSSFNGDISKWDVSNVKNMRGMFYYSQINGIFQNGRFIKL